MWQESYPDEMEELERESSLRSRTRTWEILHALRSRGHDMTKLHFFPYEGGVMIEWHGKGLYCDVDELEIDKVGELDERGLVRFQNTKCSSVEEVVDRITQYLQ